MGGSPRAPWPFGLLVITAAGCLGTARSGGTFDRGVFGEAADDPARRAAALVARLTLPEKVAQLENAAPPIPRLGVPAYDWWSESLHGVARNGRATVFPQAIGLAATFDEGLLRRVGEAIAGEARAKFEAAGAGWNGAGRYQGLTFFAPNVNIFRDPRWGRGQETYGEDPFLTARLGVAYVRGLQGDDPRRLRVAAVGKHFAVHSGPELDRHRFDARVDAHDLADTYLPQFEALVREARVSGMMAAYNRVNGVACVAHPLLLAETLRGRWGFMGFVVGDCGAVGDLVSGHRIATNDTQAAALALRAGTDLDCGRAYRSLAAALRAGLVTEAEIDRALVRLFAVRFRLGLFDNRPAGQADPGAREVASPAHLALAREAARKSLVLLENGGVLPIAAGVRRIAVVGPTADDREVLLGNYHGDAPTAVTLLAGVAEAARRRGITVEHAAGVTLAGRSLGGLPSALAAARAAELVIAVLGLSPRLEGEEGDPEGGNPAGDRRELGLPAAQVALLAAVLDLGKPTVVVLTGGSALALPRTVRRPDAVMMAWYPGEQGGHAVADVLFGDAVPSGRLPVTFYRSVDDLPPFSNYGMAGRTYRYFEGKPLYPFGYGRGYGPILYRDLQVDGTGTVPRPTGPVDVHVQVTNPGDKAVDEVVQIYAAARERAKGDPLRALVGFRRVTLAPHATLSVDVQLGWQAFSRVDSSGHRRVAPGAWEVSAAGLTATVDIPPGASSAD